jgi:hypothetical protein
LRSGVPSRLHHVDFHAVIHQSMSLSDYLPGCSETRNALIQHVLSLNFKPFGQEPLCVRRRLGCLSLKPRYDFLQLHHPR